MGDKMPFQKGATRLGPKPKSLPLAKPTVQRRGREKCVQPCWTPRLRTRAALHDKPREIVRHSLHLLHLHHHFHHHDPNTSISASHDHPSPPSRSITASLVLPPPSLPPSLSAGGLIFLLPSWILTPLDYNAHIPCPSAFSHTHPLPTFFSHTLFLPLLSNTHIPSVLHPAVLCLVSHTLSLPSPLTRSSSVGTTRTSSGEGSLEQGGSDRFHTMLAC